MKPIIFVALVAAAAIFLDGVVGHGMLLDPMNRGSMWRIDPAAPENYDDSGNFCGGTAVQWEINGGRCGLCGDDYRLPRPRDNENGGFYGRGSITRTYKKGSIIDTVTLITANHMGWLRFSICDLKDPSKQEPEDCFQTLELANGATKYMLPSNDTGYYPVQVKLPENLTCERCVLQWHYNAGNSWGRCEDGTEAIGCGVQENFRTCSDIQIV